jgi:hypothetical protein
MSDPLVSSFSHIADFSSHLKELSIDGTTISSFAGAPLLPVLVRFSCRRCPLASRSFLGLCCAAAFRAPLLLFLNGDRLPTNEARRGAALSGSLRPHLLDGFVPVAFDPLRLRNPATGKRRTLYHVQITADDDRPSPLRRSRVSPSRPVSVASVRPKPRPQSPTPFRMTEEQLQSRFGEITKQCCAVRQSRRTVNPPKTRLAMDNSGDEAVEQVPAPEISGGEYNQGVQCEGNLVQYNDDN